MSGDSPRTSTTKETENESNKSESAIELIRQQIADKLSLFSSDSDDSTLDKVIEDLTFEGFTKHWKEQGFKNVITMVGAGISTSAGIPDFRSPGSGLYNNLQKYNLPHPSAIFEMDYFNDNPKPFFALAKELYPGTFNPTPSHYFVRLLHEKGLLLRHYTQNIDTLERIAGIPDNKLVEAHGTFYNNHCLGCHKLFSMEWMKEQIFMDVVPTCDECNCVVKPDIVFFGENLPLNFYTLPSRDFDTCDLLIIMGTSLEVQPFASLIDRAGPRCVRLLINRTMVGNVTEKFTWFESEPSLLYNSPKNTRDIAYIGDCDDGVMALAKALGWADELKAMIEQENECLRKKQEQDKAQLEASKHKEASKDNKDSKEVDRQHVADVDKDAKEQKEEQTTPSTSRQGDKEKSAKNN